ncbi:MULTISPECIES: lipid kinase YegS [unclassified Agarivorans]|uniref:lipid kinase YegS n=1 Tax=unclassified Agarivorans TaxID=2636026 RepID=UPI0026E36A37|nr:MULTISPECIES: lipid kinase YegS [unclassified Agarivorans]MDO6684172.1 lipid kinase YegS [Agarivorans sp. 3_MG-2023]MDO6714094.1 lipid kinase YegS [Agarivorans sp. 2_MG-2023]
MELRLILNGKKAHLPDIREAVSKLRQQGHNIQVRVTWEGGDVERLVAEAHQQGWNSPEKKLMIGGGDGSVQEVVSALMLYPAEQRPSLAILPLGTANDFATACQIPTNPLDAITFALEHSAQMVDVISAKDLENQQQYYFMNVLTAGFGAQITAETPVELKNFLGGGAYTLSGIVQALNFKPYVGKLNSPDKSFNDGLIIGALCNGKQAGGGQILGPNAYLNDGLMDICIVRDFPATALSQVLQEAAAFGNGDTQNGEYIVTWQTPWLETKSEQFIPTNLDGEPHKFNHARFEVVPNALPLIIAQNSPCLC